MNEQSTMMNQQQQQQQLMNQMSIMNQMNPHQQQQPQPQVIEFNQPFTRTAMFSHFSNNLMNRGPQMVPMNRSYGMWNQPPQQQFQKPPNLNPGGGMKPPSAPFNKSLGPRNNWKGKKQHNDKRRGVDQQKPLIGSAGIGGVNIVHGGGGGSGGGVGNLNFNSYNPPTLNELQHQNRLKTRKFFPKKKFNKNNGMNMNMNMNMNMGGNNSRKAPFAPRNTTSFLIRAKKSGGIAPLVSPYPVTPAILPTPILSPSREVLVDMAKEEWGVDGYGSMKGLIRLRSPGHYEMEANEDEEEDEGSSSESDVEEHVEVERRLDHDLSRFEMIYDPSSVNVGGIVHHNVLENRVDDQDTHIAQLEEENLILKERLFLMERELGDLRRRMLSLERRGNGGEEINEEVVENESENESESRGEEDHSEDNDEDFNEHIQENKYLKQEGDVVRIAEGSEQVVTAEEGVESHDGKVENKDGLNAATDKNNNNNIMDVEINEESNNKSESTEPSKTEVNILDMDEGNVDQDDCVDVDVREKDAITGESNDHVISGGDVCMLEDGVAKDNMVPDNDATN